MNLVKSERKQYQKLKYNRYQKKVIIFDTITGWAFLSPVLIVAIIFVSSTIAIALWLTFQKGDTFANLESAGFRNWERIFDESINLYGALKNTVFYAVVSVPIIVITSLVISALLNSRYVRNKEVFLAIFFLPQVTSAIASTIIFKQLISPQGFIRINYYEDPTKVIWIVIISAIWGGVAGSLITMNTAFASIDKNQYEAADLDGASGFQKFTKITVPSISPIVSYALIMGMIGGLGVFDGPYLLVATTGLDPDGMITLVLKGFWYIIPPPNTGSGVNIGLGTTILFFTSLLMAISTMIANVLFPLSRKDY